MLNHNISKFFPNEIEEEINKYFEENEEEKNKKLEEIRLRTDKPIILKFNKEEFIFNKLVTQEEIIKTLQYVCDNSIYSYQNQICEGFITVKGGHRIGITGNCVIENGKVTNIKYISSLNFRVAKEIFKEFMKQTKFIFFESSTSRRRRKQNGK